LPASPSATGSPTSSPRPNDRTSSEEEGRPNWDDQEHHDQTANHNFRNQWVAANVHHDNYVGAINGFHAVDVPWEIAERTLYRRMDEHCRYLGWKVLPGSSGPFGRFVSDGKLTVILMTRIADDGLCPGPPTH